MSDTPTPRPTLPPRPVRKLAAIGAILLLMLLPALLIDGLIEEREARQTAVEWEIARSWGQPQNLLGPVVLLPWRAMGPADAAGKREWQRGSLVVLPTALQADVALAPETRRRGLFQAVVYQAHAEMTGSFTLPIPSLPDQPEAEFLWSEAQLVVGSADLRLARPLAPLAWDGRAVEPGDALAELSVCAPAETLRWPLGLQGPPPPGRAFPYSLTLDLRGTGSFHLRPLARQTRLTLHGAWPTPSFSGSDLPTTSQVDAEGFRAEWATDMPQGLLRRSLDACRGQPTEAGFWSPSAEAGLRGQSAGTGIGVALLEAVPTYRMVTRASKYGLFILALAFLTFGLFELLARVRIHPVQYALLGASVVLFPLLLLAFGEPLGFVAAYALASAAVAAQASAFTVMVTRRPLLGGILALVFGGLFSFLYVVLSLESYALIVGSLVLFAALTLVMAVSRRIEWGEA